MHKCAAASPRWINYLNDFLVNGTGTFGTPFMFTGEMMDANGLTYLRARYYNSGLGVFTSLDPVENLNLYQYVDSNPINRVDPSGLKTCEDYTCWEIKEEIGNILYGYWDQGTWIRGIVDRIAGLFEDKCCLFEAYLKEQGIGDKALPCTPDTSSCYDANGNPNAGTWKGHQDQLTGRHNALRNSLKCYIKRFSMSITDKKHCPKDNFLVKKAETAMDNPRDLKKIYPKRYPKSPLIELEPAILPIPEAGPANPFGSKTYSLSDYEIAGILCGVGGVAGLVALSLTGGGTGMADKWAME